MQLDEISEFTVILSFEDEDQNKKVIIKIYTKKFKFLFNKYKRAKLSQLFIKIKLVLC